MITAINEDRRLVVGFTQTDINEIKSGQTLFVPLDVRGQSPIELHVTYPDDEWVRACHLPDPLLDPRAFTNEEGILVLFLPDGPIEALLSGGLLELTTDDESCPTGVITLFLEKDEAAVLEVLGIEAHNVRG